MKHREKHETNRNSQLTPTTFPCSTLKMEGECGASGASTFHSRARIYRDFHPGSLFFFSGRRQGRGVPTARGNYLTS
jgi:hypothetical protein